jgi:hypothetical protein
MLCFLLPHIHASFPAPTLLLTRSPELSVPCAHFGVLATGVATVGFKEGDLGHASGRAVVFIFLRFESVQRFKAVPGCSLRCKKRITTYSNTAV